MEITLKNDDRVIVSLSGYKSLEIYDLLQKIPANEIKGFKTVLPKGRNPAAVSEMGNITAITNAYDICEIKIGGVSRVSRSCCHVKPEGN